MAVYGKLSFSLSKWEQVEVLCLTLFYLVSKGWLSTASSLNSPCCNISGGFKVFICNVSRQQVPCMECWWRWAVNSQSDNKKQQSSNNKKLSFLWKFCNNCCMLNFEVESIFYISDWRKIFWCVWNIHVGIHRFLVCFKIQTSWRREKYFPPVYCEVQQIERDTIGFKIELYRGEHFIEIILFWREMMMRISSMYLFTKFWAFRIESLAFSLELLF